MTQPNDISTVEFEASEWLVLLSAPDVSADDRARFQAWLAADPRHQRVYRRQQAAWSAIPDMTHLAYLKEAPEPGALARLAGVAQALAAAARPTLAGPLAPAAGFAAAVLIAGTLVLTGPGPWQAAPDHATAVAEIRDVTLADGSVVTLGAASALDVAFTDAERRVSLTHGEAFFAVARDADRPFVVAAGDTLVRVIGTKFDVHHGAQAVRVSVLEGRVEVSRPDKVTEPTAPSARRVLTAGQQVVAARQGDIAPTRRVEPAELASWREGRLVYVDAYLRDVVADVNRYYPGQIALGDDAAADLQLTVSFRTDQIDRMIQVLTASLPLEVERAGGARIVLRSRPEGG